MSRRSTPTTSAKNSRPLQESLAVSKIDQASFRKIIAQLYSIASELGKMFPGRKFTPDGHLVGSIGEAIATIEYGVKLHGHSYHGTDGVINGREVQIKATQRMSVAMKKPQQDDLLLVLKINSDGTWERIYDGDAQRVWDSLQDVKESYLREKVISLRRLRVIQKDVISDDRVRCLSSEYERS